jgi:hypothetical protein
MNSAGDDDHSVKEPKVAHGVHYAASVTYPAHCKIIHRVLAWCHHGMQVDPTAAGPDHFKTASLFMLRWFTPSVEVPLCGHATLASAAVIFTGELNCPAPAAAAAGAPSYPRIFPPSLTPKSCPSVTLLPPSLFPHAYCRVPQPFTRSQV